MELKLHAHSSRVYVSFSYVKYICNGTCVIRSFENTNVYLVTVFRYLQKLLSELVEFKPKSVAFYDIWINLCHIIAHSTVQHTYNSVCAYACVSTKLIQFRNGSKPVNWKFKINKKVDGFLAAAIPYSNHPPENERIFSVIWNNFKILPRFWLTVKTIQMKQIFIWLCLLAMLR